MGHNLLLVKYIENSVLYHRIVEPLEMFYSAKLAHKFYILNMNMEIVPCFIIMLSNDENVLVEKFYNIYSQDISNCNSQNNLPYVPTSCNIKIQPTLESEEPTSYGFNVDPSLVIEEYPEYTGKEDIYEDITSYNSAMEPPLGNKDNSECRVKEDIHEEPTSYSFVKDPTLVREENPEYLVKEDIPPDNSTMEPPLDNKDNSECRVKEDIHEEPTSYSFVIDPTLVREENPEYLVKEDIPLDNSTMEPPLGNKDISVYGVKEQMCEEPASYIFIIDPTLFSNEYQKYRGEKEIYEGITLCKSTMEPTLINECIVQDKIDEYSMISLGPNNTTIHENTMRNIDWSNHNVATNFLLNELFSKATLASHTLWGKSSLKGALDSKIVEDIVFIVCQKCNVHKEDVYKVITIRCNREATKYNRLTKRKRNIEQRI